MQFKENPYTWSNTSNDIKSDVVELVLRDDAGQEITITNLTEPISMYVPYDGVANQGAPYMYLNGDDMAFVEMNFSRSGLDIHLMIYVVEIVESPETDSSGGNLYISMRLLYILEEASNATNITEQSNHTEFLYIASDQLSGYDNETDGNQTRAQLVLDSRISLR